jgi:hypothetical protein
VWHTVVGRLQSDYFNIYLREYDLRVIKSLPFVRVNFARGYDDITNDYEALKASLSALRVWEFVAGLSAESMLSLRSKAGYYQFRAIFDLVAGQSENVWAVGESFARASLNSKSSGGLNKILSKYSGDLPAHGYEPENQEIEAVADNWAVSIRLRVR